MASDPPKPPVRIRKRITTTGGDDRLVADRVEGPRKKRLPNSGCMKKGETRNPNGRPKGAKGTKALVKKLLLEKTTVRESGRARRVTLYHALLLKEVQLAIAGDWRARKTMLELGRWALPEDNPLAGKPAGQDPSAADEAVIAWFESEVRARDESDDDANEPR